MALSDRLAHARRLQAIAQTGLAYTKDPYDRERFEEVRRIAAGLMADATGADADALDAAFALESGYATPKLDCRGVVVDAAGRLLLVRETQDGLWTLPGGWVDSGQTPGEAVVKEVREEAGLGVAAVRLLMVQDRDRHNTPALPFAIWKVFVECVVLDGEPHGDGHETDEIGWFSSGEWPPLSETRTTAQQLERCLALVGDRFAPTEFDGKTCVLY